MKLYELAVNKAVTFTMLFIAVTGIGLVSFFRMKPELLPDLSFPIVAVITEYKGVGPEDIETQLTRPIENAVVTVNKIKEVSSTSKEDTSMVIIEFEWGTNMDLAAIEVREKVDFIKRFLPEAAGQPMVVKFSPSMMPVMFLGVTGDINQGRLRQYAIDKIQPFLERADGVAAAPVIGGLEREIKVNLDRKKMEAMGISIQSVISAIGLENLNLPAGTIKEEKKEYLLRTVGEYKSVAEIENTVVSARPGSILYIRDVGTVRDDYKDMSSMSRINGESGVMMIIQKRSGANTVEAAGNVTKELEKLKKTLPSNIRVNVIMDQSEFIKKSIGNVTSVAAQGALLCVLVILFFLRDWRSTFIISLSIPISIIASFTALYLTGITLNIMSMGGLALAIGMLVDNSIVTLENIFRHRVEENEPVKEAAIWGASEIAMPITASTLTTIVVFLPVFFVPGLAREIFKEMAITVTLSLSISLFVALTLVPLLASRLMKGKKNLSAMFLKSGSPESSPPLSSSREGKGNRVISGIKNFCGSCLSGVDVSYMKILKWALKHRKATVFGTVLIFILCLMMIFPFRFIGTEFMPKVDSGEINITLEMPVGTRIDETNKMAERVETLIKENVPEIRFLANRIGSGGGMMGGGALNQGAHSANISLHLVDIKERSRSQFEIADILKVKLGKIPGVKIKFTSSGGGFSMMGMSGSPIEVQIYGYDMEKAVLISEKVKALLGEIPGTAEIDDNFEKEKPEYKMKILRDRVSDLGLSLAGVSRTVQSYVYGAQAGLYREGGNEYPITVRLRESDRQNFEELLALSILTPRGQKVPLSNLAEIKPSLGPVTIQRRAQERMITVSSDYKGKDLGKITQEVEQKIRKIILPPGFFMKIGGEASERKEAFLNLFLALIGALFLIYAVMASQFESFVDPFIIMFTFPLSLIGVVLLFFLTGTTISIIGFVGIILLAGIIVNNGIVLVDYTNLLRLRGFGLYNALITGGQRRFRPVLMTALTTIIGLLPMSMGIGEGAEFQAPMARAIAGGLAMGTFLTLIFIPVLYSVFSTHLAKKKEKLIIE